tara:strand:- start:183 stop:338 length:156 start_codon:yes stop_codon:yes gene_type:complete
MITKAELAAENKALKKKILKLLGVMRRARLFTRKQHEELKKLVVFSVDTEA